VEEGKEEGGMGDLCSKFGVRVRGDGDRDKSGEREREMR